MKRLGDLEELVDVPVSRGGVPFSDWERDFIGDVRRQFDESLTFSEGQREKILEIWHAADLRKRPVPDDQKVENLFSKLSPKRQAEQLERAKKVRLSWEK